VIPAIFEEQLVTSADHFQAIVIGSGQGGTPLCQALANAGRRTALIEREHVGGTCINEGCTPTKTMIASGRVAYLARRGPDYGVHTGSLRIDMDRVRARKRAIVNLFRGGNEKRIAGTKNLELISGEASFTGSKSLVVGVKNGGTRKLTADLIFINSGCRPAVPSIEGLGGVPFLDSTSIMEVAAVPEHLLVLGGGYVGLEFGQLLRRLGGEVTIIQSGKQLLGREDPDIAQEVASILEQDGVTVLLNSKAERADRAGGQINLAVRTGSTSRTISGSHVLVGTGRVPNTENLNLAAAGVAVDDRGFIKVDGTLATNVDGIYALGDVKGGPAFTHISYDDFRVLRTNLLEKGKATTEGRFVPYTVFIDPQLGRVGMTETEARAQDMRIRVAKMAMNYVARALEVDESRGFMKAIVDADSKQILGAAVLGIEGGEIMSQFQLAMMGKLPYTVLRDGVFAHPTLAESLNNLFNHFEDGGK
jgi:pyruvate/2-oxoglutarate dehydrogenase complex dihydrolipoamide dehydrogenase (E3) component